MLHWEHSRDETSRSDPVLPEERESASVKPSLAMGEVKDITPVEVIREPGCASAAGLERKRDSISVASCRDKVCTPLSASRPTPYCYMLTAIACLNSCNLGYDIGSVGGAALLMREQMGWSVVQLGLFVGSINFFSVAGALNAGMVLDRLGRRRTFALSSMIFIIGLCGQLLSQTFPQVRGTITSQTHRRMIVHTVAYQCENAHRCCYAW
jgi:hypothetical protein